MGCSSEQTGCSDDEKPAHNVTVSSYKIGKYEVTQAQWQAVMGSNPSYFGSCGNCPVENVSWNDIQDFISKLNGLTGGNFRLPTEAEWEYAARGGNQSKGYQFSGSNNLSSVAWYDETSGSKPYSQKGKKEVFDGKTHTVGLKQPNELGLYDMSGNVREWCSDWFSGSYYSNSPSQNPQGPSSGEFRVVRGGSWSCYVIDCRVADRSWCKPDLRYFNCGFRLAQDF